MAITIVQTSNWIENVVLQKDGEEEVSTGTNFLIRFVRSPAVDSFTFAHFKLYDTDEGKYLGSPWMEILPPRDYSFITKQLLLYLELPLEVNKTYRFIITGLEDGAGNVMAQDYVLEFDTAPTPSAVSFRLGLEPFTIEDHSIANPPAPPGVGEMLGGLDVIATSPPNDTIMVDPETTDKITITFSEPVSEVESDQVKVTYRPLDTIWHPFTTVPSSSYTLTTSWNELIIVFADDTSPEEHTFNYNREYRITLAEDISSVAATPTALGYEYSFSFFTVLQPLYHDPQVIMARFPEISKREVYAAVYSASLNARMFAPSLPLSPADSRDLPYAAMEYVRCRTLYMLVSAHEEEVNRMQLADLMIASDSSWSDRLLDCMDRWQYELERYGSSGARHFTKSFNRIELPDQESGKYTGTNVRPRNSWWD